jgi:hypothetical protein
VQENDGTPDVYPPYPADWDASDQKLEVSENHNIIWAFL